MSRKNMHGKVGVKFKAPWTASKEKSLLRNLVTNLVAYGRIEVPETTADKISQMADKLVTLGKRGDLHARRQAASVLRNVVVDEATGKTAVQHLFEVIAPKFTSRNGGYTRVLKVGNRLGDNAPISLVEFVA